jgi:DNA-binding GntR family transcriptional regulator
MRTSAKYSSEEQISEFIEKASRLSTQFTESIQNGIASADRFDEIRLAILNQHLHRAIAIYSQGGAMMSMLPDLLLAIDLAYAVWPDEGREASPDFLHDYYCKMVWLLVIADALEISKTYTQKLVAIWDRTGRRDWLIDFLIRARIPGRALSQEMIFPHTYGTLREAIESDDPVKAAELLSRYLEKEFYPRHKGVYWHDKHLSKHNTFFGYWSFEAAAVVKQAGIDDSSFRENEYYPKDLFG